MNNHEINYILSRHPATRSVFAGVFAKDTLSQRPRTRTPAAYVVNTAAASSNGEHWICIYVPSSGPAEYFDSYALTASKEFVKFMGGFYRKNVIPLQNIFTTVCGQYCIYYICMRYVYHKSMDEILAQLSEERALDSDEYANKFVELFFGRDLDVQDIDFIIESL